MGRNRRVSRNYEKIVDKVKDTLKDKGIYLTDSEVSDIVVTIAQTKIRYIKPRNKKRKDKTAEELMNLF